MAIGGASVSALLEKLASADLIGWFGGSSGKYSELEKWGRTLFQIQAVLIDAGEKTITMTPVRLWLNKLQQLTYDIDDVLDELTTEAARRRQMNERSSAPSSTMSISKVLKLIPTRSHAFQYSRKMGSKLDEITSKLSVLVEESHLLGLIENYVPRSNNTTSFNTSLVPPNTILVREGDKEALMKRLLGDDIPAASENFSVLSITGMGGIGKTTLARVLYNDNKVKDHFELRAWVSVSHDFDVFAITKAIYESVIGMERIFATLNLLQVALAERLSNKRFLLVLDDVWNEDYFKWDLLQSPFLVGAPGSKIIVTTRSETVASVMGSVHTHHLGVLSNEDAMSLFAQSALGEQNFDSHPDLKQIAQGFIQKCGGLPLALITLGRMLSRDSDIEKWKELLNRDLLNFHYEDFILPALRLSYNDLPWILKQLFAYCSLFPLDYVFQKDELVLLWMAEGFLNPLNHMSMKRFGLKCFEELLSRAFFQHSTDDNQYIMHDLIRHLAKNVAGEFFLILDDENRSSYESEALDKVRHLSFVRQQVGNKEFEVMLRTRRLRTLLAVSANVDGQKKFLLSNDVLTKIIPQLQFLRVLNLSNYSITEIPESIGSLKHIRYLNFSKTDITRLPVQVGDLYNLQSLLLRGCENLFSLPMSLVNLSNLRYLDISDTPRLDKNLLRIGKLKDLQSKVIIEGIDGFKMSERKGLLNIRGKLVIEGHNVKDPIQARDVNLQQKKDLDEVVLKWNDDFDDPAKRITEYEVLAGLIPHHELRSLKILFYGGVEFPRWVGGSSFVCLAELTLRGCRRCSQLPTLGELKSLQKLYVEGMNGVKNLGSELLGPADSAFPSLQVLEFKDMQGWEEWSICSGDNSVATTWFPNLGEISIVNCPQLDVVSVGLIQSLRVLRIQRSPKAVLESMVCVSSSIVKLMIEDIKGLTGLYEVLKHLSKVEYLSIKRCEKLKYLWETESEACKKLVHLSKLEVEYCKSLVSLEKKKGNLISSMKSLKHMDIRNCVKLWHCQCPNSIERLVIGDCPTIKSLTFLTVKGTPQSSLNILDIQRCDNLGERWLLSNFLKPLEYLEMGRLPNLRSMPEGCFVRLTRLILRGCDHIESITEKGLDFGRLRVLEIISCMGLKSFPHEYLPNLKSLEDLWISNCPSLDSFPCGKWPPTLRSLTIGGLKKPMSKWGPQDFPSSLVTLYLHGENSGLVSFASNSTPSAFLLPDSLSFLEINGFPQLKSISDGLQHLTNLEGLVIDSCPKLDDLPVARLSKLLSLKVYNCLKLQERCHGRYRSIISEISELYV